MTTPTEAQNTAVGAVAYTAARRQAALNRLRAVEIEHTQAITIALDAGVPWSRIGSADGRGKANVYQWYRKMIGQPRKRAR